MTTATEVETPVDIELRAGNYEAYYSTARELLVEGGAGTGKTFGILLKRNSNAQEFPGYHGLIIRKTAVTLASTVLRTFEERVLHEWDPNARRSALDHVHFFGGSQNEPASYVYDNGSRINVGGMDQASKVLGTDYDDVYENEATEFSLEEHETLLSRLRHGVIPPQLVADCNPTYNKHWLLLRCAEGRMVRIRTRLEDNPAYWQDGEWTPLGRAYLDNLESMTGTRYQRFRLGEWVGVENAIYDNFDRFKHLAPIRTDEVFVDGAIGVDYGDVHPHAVVAVSRTSGGRLVVRETWCGRSYDDLVSVVGRLRRDTAISRVRVDPMLKGWEKPENSPLRGRVNRADASPGSRKNRIEYVRRLFDDNALTLDIHGEGNRELADEIEMYHYVHRQTDTQDDLVVARINEDRVAALEYAIEELEGVQHASIGRAHVAGPEPVYRQARGMVS